MGKRLKWRGTAKATPPRRYAGGSPIMGIFEASLLGVPPWTAAKGSAGLATTNCTTVEKKQHKMQCHNLEKT